MSNKIIVGISTQTDKKGIDDLNKSVKGLSDSVGDLNDSFEEVSDSGDEMQKRVDAAIGKLSEAKTLQELKKSLKEVKSLQLEIGDTGDANFKKLASSVAEANDKMDDMNEIINSSKGEPIERIRASFGGVGQSLKNLDFKQAKSQFSILSDSIKSMSSDLFGGFNALKVYKTAMNEGATSTEALKIATQGFGKALTATGIGLIVIAVASLIANFDKLKESGGIVGKVFTAIGDTLKFLTEGIFKLTDAMHLTDKAGKDAYEKRMKQLEDEKQKISDRYDHEINMAKNAGKNTAQIEQEKLAFIAKNAYQQQKEYYDRNKDRLKDDEEKLKEYKRLTEERKKADDAVAENAIANQKRIADLDIANTNKLNNLKISGMKDGLSKQIASIRENLRQSLEENKKVKEEELANFTGTEADKAKLIKEYNDIEVQLRSNAAKEINKLLQSENLKRLEKAISDEEKAATLINEDNTLLNEEKLKLLLDNNDKQVAAYEALYKKQVELARGNKQELEDLKKEHDFKLTEYNNKRNNLFINSNNEGLQKDLDNQRKANEKKLKEEQDAAQKTLEIRGLMQKMSGELTLQAMEQDKQRRLKSLFAGFGDIKQIYNEEEKYKLKLLERQYNADKTNIINNVKDIDEEIKLLKTLNEKYASDQVEIHKKTNEEITAERQKMIAKWSGMAQQISDTAAAIGEVFSQADQQKIDQLTAQTDAQKELTDQRIADIDRETEARLAAIDQENISDQEKAAKKKKISDEAVAQKNAENRKLFQLELSNFNASEALRKKIFEREKKFQIANAIITTAAAVAGMLAAQPIGPWNAASAVLTGIAGAAQIAKISSTQFESGTPPKFEEIFPSNSGSSGSGISPAVSSTAGQQRTLIPEQLQYMKVYVSETDIRSVSQKAEVIENRNIIV